MKVEIKSPCSEDWDKMKIGMFSRHCDSCDKSVIDFTKMERYEIIMHLLANTNEKVCGRMNKQQFDFHHEDVPVLIRALGKRGGNVSFLILSLVCLSLVACKEDNGITKNIKTPPPIHKEGNTEYLGKVSYAADTTETKITNTKMSKPVPVALPIPGGGEGWRGEGYELGEVIIDPEPHNWAGAIEPTRQLREEDTVLAFADKMPEFEGGVQALYKFINENLKYPEYEREANISGTVYVKFIVSIEGKVSKPTILKSVSGSHSFDKEVLRVINILPDWIPGEQNGKKVNVYFSMPVKFKLD
jgi:TonB family protein